MWHVYSCVGCVLSRPFSGAHCCAPLYLKKWIQWTKNKKKKNRACWSTVPVTWLIWFRWCQMCAAATRWGAQRRMAPRTPPVDQHLAKEAELTGAGVANPVSRPKSTSICGASLSRRWRRERSQTSMAAEEDSSGNLWSFGDLRVREGKSSGGKQRWPGNILIFRVRFGHYLGAVWTWYCCVLKFLMGKYICTFIHFYSLSASVASKCGVFSAFQWKYKAKWLDRCERCFSLFWDTALEAKNQCDDVNRA